MYSPEELKQQKEILSKVDWEMTPQEAFESYQIKSINPWQKRGLEDAYYFAVYVRQDQPRVFLIRRTLKDSEELAELPVPRDLVVATLPKKEGGGIPHGQYPVEGPVKEWLRKEMGY